MKLVVVSPYGKSRVYHDLGHKMPHATGREDHVAKCGGIRWYANTKEWLRLEEDAIAKGLRPCLLCFGYRYIKNVRSLVTTETTEDYERSLEWR